MSPTDRPKAVSCLPADEIRALLLGRGPNETADRLARHLPSCPHCAAVADAIGLDSGVVSGLRRENLPPPPSEHEFADVVARVSRISYSHRSGRSRPAAAMVDVPGRLGPYRLVELLGAGGMGVVYRAEDVVLNRFVAVKVVKNADADTRARFLSEARALAAVRHDNVVTVHYVGEEPTGEATIPYLAMELLEGQTLRDWTTAAPNPPIEWVVRTGRQIAAGLASVHDTGMVHRDVKPGNLWLEAPQGWAARPPEERPSLADVGRVKLLDFGLAHPPGVTIEDDIAGTPAYMAPEQARGEAVDARTDLFALGCVLYELCAGRLPFPERNRRWTGRDAAPEPVHTLNPAVPSGLADLIERLLAPDRADRPASARAVELELAGLDTTSTGTPTLSGRKDATVEITPVTPPRRRRHLLTPTAALLVAVGVVAAVALTRHTDTPRDSSDDRPAPQPVATAEKEPAVTDQQKAPVASAVIDEEWYHTVSAQPPQTQLNEVLRALDRLNPKFEWLNGNGWNGSGWVEPYGVIRLTVNADTVTDLRPVRALKALNVVRCRGSAPGLGTLTDLSPLSELTLKELHCRNNPGLTDLSPIRLDGLEFLDASYTGLETLAGLTKAPLVTLKIAGTPIDDLGPVRKMSKLRALDCAGSPITDFTPLAAVSLRELTADVRADRDAAVLGRIKTLEKINRLPVKEFWKKHSANRSK